MHKQFHGEHSATQFTTEIKVYYGIRVFILYMFTVIVTMQQTRQSWIMQSQVFHNF